MRLNDTVLYKVAGIFWGIQTILSLINIISEKMEGLSLVVGLVIMVLYGVCTYGLFTGDTYKFYKSIKIFSIIIYVACGILIFVSLTVISRVGGMAIGLIIIVALIIAEFWALTKLAGMADDNEPVDRFWFVPGVIYVFNTVFSYIFMNSLAATYSLNLSAFGGLNTDNIIMVVFGLAMYFVTGYAFYDAQKQAVVNAPATTNYQPQQGTYNVYNPSNMNNANNMYNTNNMNSANNMYNTNNYSGDNDGNSENSYSSGSYNLNGNIVGEESEKKSAFTLKKD